ncbi:head maturation protease, ClpP-related [Lysobacter fragariae]
MNQTNRLTRLLALNRSAPRAYKIEAKDDEATVFLYDVIGYDWWTGDGVTAKQFAKDLQAINAKTLHLRINSPGGDVFEGRAMVAALQAHPAHKIAHVDGLAASAASFIAMHADEVEMTDGSFMMIHNGWTIAIGDRHAMQETAALLEKIDASIVDDYQHKTNANRDEIAQWMDDETWMTAAEAVDRGFADRVAGSEKDGKAKASAWNVAAYDHPPAALAASEPAQPANEPDYAAEHAHRMRAVDLADRKKVEKSTA